MKNKNRKALMIIAIFILALMVSAFTFEVQSSAIKGHILVD